MRNTLILCVVLAFFMNIARGHQYSNIDELIADVCTQHSFGKCADPVVDSDGDGLPDDIDECPADPTNTCNDPIDTDGDGIPDSTDECPNDATNTCNNPIDPPIAGAVTCPDEVSYNSARWDWYLCNLNIANEPYYSPYGIDFPLSYMTPRASNFTTGSSRLSVYMHPSQSTGTFVKGPSSFRFSQDQVEIHTQEERYLTNPTGSWWGFSGNSAGSVENYNGRRIVAGIDYVLARHGDKIDLDKGIELMGKSLGGAGAMHQAMILPKYQDKIAIVNSIIGLMMIPKNHHADAPEWGEDHWDEADIRLQWAKVQNIHFSWRGGANDGLGRFDTEFIDICELRKISCSLAWLQSGHSITESGYSLNMSAFTHTDQTVTLDVVLPVITNNSSNHHGELRGYHNRGVTWNHSEITDTATEIQIPLQYIAEKNLGPDLPDQPGTATFSITPRHVKNFDLSGTVNWTFGAQSGSIVAGSDGLVTINGLALSDGAGYQVLSLKKP